MVQENMGSGRDLPKEVSSPLIGRPQTNAMGQGDDLLDEQIDELSREYMNLQDRSRLWDRVRGYVPLLPFSIVFVILILPTLAADLIAPHSAVTASLPNRLAPPFWLEGGTTEHLLGTDRLGRDILSRVIFGARISATVALVGVGISAVLGTLLGLIAGYRGGIIDVVVMRMVDITLAFPAVLFALVIAAAFGPSFTGLLAVLVFILWSYFARQVRGQTLSLMKEDFIAQAHVTGQSAVRIMARHLFPNVGGGIITLATIQIGYVIVLESTLSFLGIGLPRPTPAWGLMVADGRDMIVSSWWVSLFPGLALTLVVLGFNAWGDYLRDKLDPRGSHG